MIDIPGIYVGRFKTDPNNRPALMTRENVPTYTNDNWANVESTGTIWRYSSKAGEWIDTGLEEILVEEVTGTKEIVAEGTVPWNLQGLKVYGKSTQDGEPSPESPVPIASAGDDGNVNVNVIGKNLLNLSKPIINGYNAVLELKNVKINLNTQYTFLLNKTINDIKFGLFLTDTENILDSTKQFDLLKEYLPVGSSKSFIFPNNLSEYSYLAIAGDKPGISSSNVKDLQVQLEVGPTATPYEPYKSQSLTISTPNGLPGIPVDSGGNFTDETGQQWVCDEIDYARGVYVQRIAQVEFDGSSDELWALNTNTNAQRTYFWITVEKTAFRDNDADVLLCSAFPYMRYGYAEPTGNNTACFQSNNLNFTCSTSLFDNMDEWMQYLTRNAMTLIYAIATPIETPLSDEELAAYAALMSYNDRTVIYTDEDVSGMSAKVVTDVISKNEWFDPSAELALYYKALAGFKSLDNLPMPHSRESSLIRKLLDSSYELGFTVTENSGRNERYLWDLINGTTSMLANVPKSDTEKFLHVMIGGTVEEYPVVDTELDYWMDKCVNYMDSNNIGG